MATPCYTVYIPDMEEYLKWAIFWLFASYTVLVLLGWFSNRTGMSLDDGARKSNNWIDQWQSDKLDIGSQV